MYVFICKAMVHMLMNIHSCKYVREYVYFHVRVDRKVYVYLYLPIFAYKLTIMCLHNLIYVAMRAQIHKCDWNRYTWTVRCR